MRLDAVDGDITAQAVDAIVNAANPWLLGGSGVDGAIHAAAGPALHTACLELRRTTHPDGLAVGDAVATRAGELPARWVVHTVGPNRRAGQRDPALLASSFSRSLEVAAGLGAATVAMPAVGAGIYGWDVDEVADIAVAAVRDTGAAGRARGVELVRFVLWGNAAHTDFLEALARP